ncbi:MAG: hypothetical protein D6753_14220 [Planctomycetota bacterium]|nr:MAG: hypothetical protein D6753_14220 [Planctomycetota bacterium]
MRPNNAHPVPTTSIQIHQSFSSDLTDGEGMLLLRAGEKASAELLRELARRDCQTVFLHGPPPADSSDPPRHRATLDRSFRDAALLIQNAIWRIQTQQQIAAREFIEPIIRLEGIISDDSCLILDFVMTTGAQRESPIAMRSAQLSMLVQLLASEMGFPRPMCRLAARAAMLSDLSLLQLDDPRQLLQELTCGVVSPANALRYNAHPEESARMIEESIPDAHPLESVLIRQSHEHSDGTGFPRGLTGRVLHPLSRIINLVDVFLMLTETNADGRRLAPADALAYLILHSLYGTFDLEVVRALVRVAAVYPVGTDVVLTDQRLARVIRSDDRHYLDPIVRIDGTGEELKLHYAPQKIAAPAIDSGTVRLPKARLDERLWDIVVREEQAS